MEAVTRRKEEFWCDTGGGGCGKYFLTYLRDNMTGAYTIQCPNDGTDVDGKPVPGAKACNHHHFRRIVNGLVTSDRARDDKDVHGKILLGLKSTLRDTPWHDDPEFRRTLLKRVK